MPEIRKPFGSGIYSPHGISFGGLRDLAMKEPENFQAKFERAVESGKIKLTDIRDIRALWQSFVDVPVKVSLPDISGSVRTITTSAFPIMTGSLVIAQMNQAYMDLPTIGQNLVTEMDDNKKITFIAGLSALDNKKTEVKEGEDFPEISATEAKYEIRHRLNGRKLTMSAAVIEENNIASFALLVNDLGKFINRRIEKLTLERVTDYHASKASPAAPYVYRPDGVGTALFSATANTPGTRCPSGNRINSNDLVDETDLDAARELFAGFKDDNGERIGIARSRQVILVPDAKVKTLAKILNSQYVPGVENEISNWGPSGMFHVPMERVFSTPLLDDLSTVTWYYGDFQSQFIRKWKLRFEYASLGMDTQAFLNARIAAQYRIAYDVEVGARDYVYVVQCLSATTAPGDETTTYVAA